jgi:hypothetical protein
MGTLLITWFKSGPFIYYQPIPVAGSEVRLIKTGLLLLGPRE